VWSVVVEVDSPQIAGMAEAVEQMFVQAFVANPPVEALYEPVLHWLTRGDVVPVNLAVLLPLQDRI
jgi:hypothetical protein